jgi:hypothetical protein
MHAGDETLSCGFRKRSLLGAESPRRAASHRVFNSSPAPCAPPRAPPMAAAQVANRLAALEAAVAQLPALLARIEALEAQVAVQAAAAAPAPKRRKKPTLWWTAVGAAALPTVPPGVPPKTAETTAPLRAARLVLVRQFWPNIAGAGGAESCAVCHANGVAWGKCRGYGGSALNHGPNVPDASDKFPVGAYVQSTAVTGQVTAYDAASGFHTVTPAAGAAKSLFLVHKSYAAVCVAAPQPPPPQPPPPPPPPPPPKKKRSAPGAAKTAGQNGGETRNTRRRGAAK